MATGMLTFPECKMRSARRGGSVAASNKEKAPSLLPFAGLAHGTRFEPTVLMAVLF